MAQAQDLTAGGGAQTATALTSTAGQIIKNGPGRLEKVLVTTTTAQVVTFYDNAAGTATGTIIGVMPTTQAAGTMFSFNMPAAVGISVVGAAGAGQITISYC